MPRGRGGALQADSALGCGCGEQLGLGAPTCAMRRSSADPADPSARQRAARALRRAAAAAPPSTPSRGAGGSSLHHLAGRCWTAYSSRTCRKCKAGGTIGLTQRAARSSHTLGEGVGRGADRLAAALRLACSRVAGDAASRRPFSPLLQPFLLMKHILLTSDCRTFVAGATNLELLFAVLSADSGAQRPPEVT
jgi:hypothetical protein